MWIIQIWSMNSCLSSHIFKSQTSMVILFFFQIFKKNGLAVAIRVVTLNSFRQSHALFVLSGNEKECTKLLTNIYLSLHYASWFSLQPPHFCHVISLRYAIALIAPVTPNILSIVRVNSIFATNPWKNNEDTKHTSPTNISLKWINSPEHKEQTIKQTTIKRTKKTDFRFQEI